MDKPKGMECFTEQEIESAIKWANSPENQRIAILQGSFTMLLVEKYLEEKYGSLQDVEQETVEKELGDIFKAVFALKNDKIHLKKLDAFLGFMMYVALKTAEQRQNASQS